MLKLVFLLGEKKKERMFLKSYLLVERLKTGLRLGVHHLIDVSACPAPPPDSLQLKCNYIQ